MTKNSLTLVAIGLGVISVCGCRERNPAYLEKVVPKDGAVEDVPSDSATLDRPADLADVSVTPRDSRDVVPGGDRGPEQRETGSDANVEEDAVADARDARDGRDTPRPGDERPEGGTGEDVSLRDAPDAPLLSDALDAPALPLDLGVDSSGDDTAPVEVPPLCHERDTRPCSSPQNPLLGACRAGLETCSGGVWGDCVGEVKPASAELCGNGIDDDCNGITDDGCTDGCIVVGPSADAVPPDGSPAHPFSSLDTALAFVASTDGGTSSRVCVAASACDQTQPYVLSGPLTVPGGVLVQGNYALQGGVLTYCAGVAPPVTALQLAAADAAVVFADSALPAELAGFVIQRFSQAGGGTATAVAVHGAKNVTLGQLFVTDEPQGYSTYGVLVDNGGSVAITGSAMRAGAGSVSAHGVFVNGGSVTLRNNCDGAGSGRCDSSCANGVLGIRGRSGVNVGGAAGDSSAVYLAAGSTASTLVANLLCGGSGGGTSDVLAAAVAALRCVGDACTTVAGNVIEGGGGRFSLGVAVANGAGLLDGNRITAGCGSLGAAGMLLEAAGVRAQNNLILATPCPSATGGGAFQGVRMVLGASGEAELHSNDIDPGGSGGDCEARGIDAVRTQAGAGASGVLRNNIIAAGDCRTRTAIYEGESAALRLIESNDLYAQPTSGATVTTTLVRRAGTSATTAVQVNLLAGATGNISANPQFVSYPDDLHLSAGSPCVDRGMAAGAPATDIEGNPRPQGAGYDIGAYEAPAP